MCQSEYQIRDIPRIELIDMGYLCFSFIEYGAFYLLSFVILSANYKILIYRRDIIKKYI